MRCPPRNERVCADVAVVVVVGVVVVVDVVVVVEVAITALVVVVVACTVVVVAGGDATLPTPLELAQGVRFPSRLTLKSVVFRLVSGDAVVGHLPLYSAFKTVLPLAARSGYSVHSL